MKTLAAGLKNADVTKKIVGLVLLSPLALMLSTAVTGTNNYMLLFVVAGLVFLTVLTDFRVGLVLIVASSYFISFSLYHFHLPKTLISLPYFLIILILLREFLFTANMRIVRTPVNYLLMLIVALGLLSIAHGESAMAASFKGLLRHVGYPLLFILILTAEPSEKLTRRLVYIILIIAMAQIPASAWQFFYYLVINPKDHGFRADHSCGLLGYSCGGHTAVLMAMTFCIMIAFSLVKGFSFKRALLAMATIVPVFLASARAGVLMFAIGAFFMTVFAPLQKHIGLAKRVFLGTLMISAMLALILLGAGGEEFKHVLDFDYMYEYSIKQADAGMGRLQVFGVVKEMLADPVSRLIGLGPGMLTPTEFLKNPRSLVAQDAELYRNMTGYAVTTIEIGFLGLALFLALYFRVYRFVRRFLRQIDDPFWEAISLGFCGVTIVYIIATLYVDAWIYFPLPFTYWALAAAIYRIGIIKGILPS
jgi:hypothetical protein